MCLYLLVNTVYIHADAHLIKSDEAYPIVSQVNDPAFELMNRIHRFLRSQKAAIDQKGSKAEQILSLRLFDVKGAKLKWFRGVR